MKRKQEDVGWDELLPVVSLILIIAIIVYFVADGFHKRSVEKILKDPGVAAEGAEQEAEHLVGQVNKRD